MHCSLAGLGLSTRHKTWACHKILTIQSCLFPVTEPAPAFLCVLLFLLVFLASEGDVSQLVLDELLLGRHPLRQRDEERLHLLPVAVDLFLLALREMHPPVREWGNNIYRPSWTGLCVRHNHNGKWHNKRIQTDTLGKLVMHCNNHLILGGTTNWYHGPYYLSTAN